MRKVGLALLGVALVGLLGRTVYLASLSPEGRILRRLELMTEGFNETRMGPILAGLDASFRTEPGGATREDLRGGLVHLFFTDLDPETKRFLHRAEIEPDPRVTLVPDAPRPTAHMEATLSLFLRKPEGEELNWRARVTGTWERNESDEWRLVLASHETLDGDGPPRGGRSR